MKKLIYTFLLLVIYSCGLSEEQSKEHEALLTKQYEFALNDAEIYRIMFAQHRAETLPNSFTTSQHIIINQLDSIQKQFAKRVEKLKKKEKINYSEFKSEYLKNLEIFQYFFDSLEHRPEKDEGIIASNLDVLEKIYSKKSVIFQMRTDLTMSYANYLRNIYYYLDGNCGFSISELETNSNLDSTGNILIKLSSEAFQQVPKGRNLILESVKKDGKEIETDYNFVPNYSFSDLIVPTKGKGKYLVKGKVVYYTKKGRKEFPFEEAIVIE